MNYIIKGHQYSEELVSAVMLFYPNEKFTPVENTGEGLTVVSDLQGLNAEACIYENGEIKAKANAVARDEGIKEIKRAVKLSLYKACKKIVNARTAWGILTGVRPAKLVSMLMEQGLDREEISERLKEDYLVEHRKAELAIKVAESEKAIVEKGKGKESLYIGIPFCPTRCLYCSFTSYPLDKYHNKVDIYLDCLEKEMAYISAHMHKQPLESIYIGGGTPTSLNEEQFERLLYNVEKYFPKPLEYTVEAGRPDTLTREKFRLIKKYGANRISINPQTLNNSTLETIGRKHTAEMFEQAFAMAREEGCDHINTDIIVGLPNEGVKELEHTLNRLNELSPESITVHTLAIKRASRLRENLDSYHMADGEEIEKMLELCGEYAKTMGMEPYYMYRQKNMLGNFENVGYCKPNCQCIYNVQIMEEKQTVIALGAGASTKIYTPEGDNIERIFNVKSVDDYISRIEEMLERKRCFKDQLLKVK